MVQAVYDVLSEAALDSSPVSFPDSAPATSRASVSATGLASSKDLVFSAVAKEEYKGKILGYSQNEWTLDLSALLRGRVELIAYHGSPVLALHGNGANAAVFHQVSS